MKKDNKTLKKQWQASERASFLASLPMSETKFHQLFDQIERALNQKDCDHTPKIAKQFLAKQQLDETQVLNWLGEYGGYCDCEILNNVSEHFPNWHSAEVVEIPKMYQNLLAKKQKINSIQTDFGFAITSVPAPWKLTQSTESQSLRYYLQIGKGMSACLASVATDNIIDNIDNDDFWLNDYYKNEIL